MLVELLMVVFFYSIFSFGSEYWFSFIFCRFPSSFHVPLFYKRWLYLFHIYSIFQLNYDKNVKVCTRCKTSVQNLRPPNRKQRYGKRVCKSRMGERFVAVAQNDSFFFWFRHQGLNLATARLRYTDFPLYQLTLTKAKIVKFYFV